MKKLAMVGYASSWTETPWEDKTFEIWIMNGMYLIAPRYDRVFDIHDLDEIKHRPQKPDEPKHYEALKTLTKPVYMQEHYGEIPASVKFPLNELTKKFYIPAMGDKLFTTCTVTHMLMLAIHEGFDEIHLYGIDEAVDGEYKDEMPGVLYWLGVAHGKGIKIVISEHSPLLKGFWVYGYEDKPKSKYIEMLDGEIKRITEIEDASKARQLMLMKEEMKCAGAKAILEHIKMLQTKI
jgi:hypothetical protein